MDHNTRMTGEHWAAVLKLTIESPDGWEDAEAYKTDKIRKFEFLERASLSKISKTATISRREAALFKNRLRNPLNDK